MIYNIKPKDFDENFKTEFKWGDMIIHVSAYSWRLGSAYIQNCPRGYGYSICTYLNKEKYGNGPVYFSVGMIKSKDEIIPKFKEGLMKRAKENLAEIVKLSDEIDRLKFQNAMIEKGLNNEKSIEF